MPVSFTAPMRTAPVLSLIHIFSLDTLDPALFAKITARDEFAAVQAGIHAALESGIPVKLNCVPQRCV